MQQLHRYTDRRRPSSARHWQGKEYQVRILDPANAPEIKDRQPAAATAYVGPRVIIRRDADSPELRQALEDLQAR